MLSMDTDSSDNADWMFDPSEYLSPAATAERNLAVALRLAGHGLCVFPTRPDKSPRVAWSKLSTTDINQIRRWWATWPDSLVGLDLAKAGLVAIDADRHGGPDGVAAFEALAAAHGPPDGAPVTETPSGGQHWFFHQPEGAPLGNRTGGLPPGIDVRGSGGLVIAPGSALADGRAWEGEPATPDLAEAFVAGAIPQLPAWLAEMIRAPKDGEPQAEERPLTISNAPAGARERAWAMAALERVAADLAATGEGGRNHALNAAAYRLGRIVARGWIAEGEARAALEDACRTNGLCKDGPREVRATIASGLRGGLASPIEDLPERDEGDPSPVTRLAAEIGRALDDASATTSDQRPEIDPLDGFIFDGDVSPEPPPMLVKKLVPFDGICFIGGQSGAGKTFIAVDLAVSLASGEPFFGHKVSERVGVAIFAAEGASTIPNRVAVARNHKALGEILPIAWLGAVPNLADPREVRAMIGRLRAVDDRFRTAHGARLGAVVCDTLAASFSLGDENDNSEAAKAIRAMKGMSDALRVVVLPVHHFGKAAETGLRGASGWRAGCDAVLSVLADRDQTTGACSNRRIALTKSRVGEEGWVAPFDLRFVELGSDADGETFGACYVECGRPSEPDCIITLPKQKPLARDAKVYLDALRVVLCERGKKVRPFGSDGPEVCAVDREEVRGEFYRSRPADGDDEKKIASTRQKAFKRGEDEVRDRRHIASYEVSGRFLVWLVKEEAQ